MNKEKLQDLYCAANATLTETFNIGSLAKEPLQKKYNLDGSIMGCLQQFKVYPPVADENGEIDECAEIAIEMLEAQGFAVTNSAEEYDAALTKGFQRHAKEVLMGEGDADVYTIFRKSVLNLTRELFYDNVMLLAAKAGLPSLEERRFIEEVEETKRNGLLDIYGVEELSHAGYQAAHSNLIQDVNVAEDVLGERLSLCGGPEPVSEERIKLVDERLAENREMADYILGDSDFGAQWALHFEAHRLDKIYEQAKDLVEITTPNMKPSL